MINKSSINVVVKAVKEVDSILKNNIDKCDIETKNKMEDILYKGYEVLSNMLEDSIQMEKHISKKKDIKNNVRR